MERKVINPWGWQDNFGFVQANELSGFERVLFCAGQTSTDPEGNTLHVDDMRGQVTQAMDNLETVLKQAGLNLSNVMRLNYYTTDVDRFFEAYEVITGRLEAAGCKPAATLLGISRLAFPELLIEIEATAVV